VCVYIYICVCVYVCARARNPRSYLVTRLQKVVGPALGYTFNTLYLKGCRSQWPRGLKRWSAAARLLRLCVRISPEAWISVRCECCVLSGRGLCDELITRPGESYRLWSVVVCDLETSRMRRSWARVGPQRHRGGGETENLLLMFEDTQCLCIQGRQT